MGAWAQVGSRMVELTPKKQVGLVIPVAVSAVRQRLALLLLLADLK